MPSRQHAASIPHAAPVDPVAAAVDTVSATLASPAFLTAMVVALTRRPARNAHDIAKTARQVLERQFAAELDGVRLTVTWDGCAQTNVIRAEADRRG